MNVRTLCLGILHFGDATGYEIKKLAEEDRFSHFIEASYGSIYPALRQLEEDGLVTCRESFESGKPAKKIYSLNETGRSTFRRALNEPPAPDKFKSEFLFLLLNTALLPPEHVKTAVERRIAELENEVGKLDHCREDCSHDGSYFVMGYARAVCRAAADFLAENIEDIALTGGAATKTPNAAE